MRVLVIAQYFPPDMGGGATRASNVVKGSLGKSCDVTEQSLRRRCFSHATTKRQD